MPLTPSPAAPCPHDPRQTLGARGMYHCPVCGAMVLAGVAHPDETLLPEESDTLPA